MAEQNKNNESTVPASDLALDEIAADIVTLNASELPKYRNTLNVLDEAYQARTNGAFHFLDVIVDFLFFATRIEVSHRCERW